MPQIAEKVRLFNEAFKLAQAMLNQRGVTVIGPIAERLSMNIRALMEARAQDAEAIAKEAVDSMA